MHRIEVEFEIRFLTRWHCGSGEGGLFTDRLVRRDSRDRPCIPGSTLRGIVRESCERLARSLGLPEPTDPHEGTLTHRDAFVPLESVLSPVDEIFGTRFEEGGLFFRDARLDGPPLYATEVRNRIRMNRVLGTARDRHLFESEYALPSDQLGARFVTRVDGHHRHLRSLAADELPVAFCLLVAAILAVDRIGGDKSTGAGRVRIDLQGLRYNGQDCSPEQVLDQLEFYADEDVRSDVYSSRG